MQTNDDILNLLKEKGAQASKQAQRGAILQPGAIGDCILTLPLAKFMKDSLGLGGIDIIGHTDYIDILSGRTCIDGIRSMDSMDLHRLFAPDKTFDLSDGDPLINAFDDYVWIVTFLGEPNSNFEQNLIYTVNCSHSAEVITLSLKPAKSFSGHLTDFYIQQFVEQSGLSLKPEQVKSNETFIKATKSDIHKGKELLKEIDVDAGKKLVMIQPGSGGSNKCWHIDNFLAIAEQLGSEGIEVIFLLGPAELDRFSKTTLKKISGAAKCLMDLSLTQVLALLSCADAFLGNDSGITHLTAAMGIKTFAVFGPTNPAVYGPIGPNVTVFAKKNKTFAKKPSPSLQQKICEILLA
jgi:ADP-heptose:LPS heptosyltransferase